jgi:hypothetical protein
VIPKPAKRGKKPKRPIRRKAKRKAKLHDADKLFSQYIRGRDGWACVRCLSPYSPQCAHLVSRRYRATRWVPENATTLCQKCHMRFTHNPIAFEDWCEERWPGRLEMMKGIARANIRQHDHAGYDELCESLRAAIGIRGGR